MKNTDPVKRSTQKVQNLSFDEQFLISTFLSVESDGTNLRYSQTKLAAKKIYDDGTGNVYVCIAPIGTLEATAGWQCKKIYDDGSGTTVITWADGNANFDNVATNPAGLSYS